MDLRTAEGVCDFVAKVTEVAKASFALAGKITPVAFLMITKNPRTGEKLTQAEPVVLDVRQMMTPERKDLLADTLRAMARESAAVGVLLILECWTLCLRPGAKPEEIQEWLEEHGTLEKHPDCKEAVTLQLEHVALGQKAWNAIITRQPDGSAQLGDFREVLGNSEGRFTDFLPHGSN